MKTLKSFIIPLKIIIGIVHLICQIMAGVMRGNYHWKKKSHILKEYKSRKTLWIKNY